MSRLQELSPNAEIVSKDAALQVNIAAANGLQNVLKSNLGPRGTLKMVGLFVCGGPMPAEDFLSRFFRDDVSL